MKREATLILFAAGLALGGCALPAATAHQSAAADDTCADAYTGSRLGCGDKPPEGSGAVHQPAVGMDMPTHPH